MYTFRGCESHHFCMCHLTFLKSEHSRPFEEQRKYFFFWKGQAAEGSAERIYGIPHVLSSSPYYSQDMHTEYTLTLPWGITQRSHDPGII